MNNNTRVLACQIDEKLQKEMKEYILKKGITVKAYVTGLIKADLEKNAIKESSKKNLEEQIVEKAKKEESKNKQQVDKSTKEESKNKVVQENMKKDIKKTSIKNKQKEEEEEFE